MCNSRLEIRSYIYIYVLISSLDSRLLDLTFSWVHSPIGSRTSAITLRIGLQSFLKLLYPLSSFRTFKEPNMTKTQRLTSTLGIKSERTYFQPLWVFVFQQPQLMASYWGWVGAMPDLIGMKPGWLKVEVVEGDPNSARRRDSGLCRLRCRAWWSVISGRS